MTDLMLLLLETEDPKLSEEEQSVLVAEADWSPAPWRPSAGVGQGEGQGVGSGLGNSRMGDRHFP